MKQCPHFTKDLKPCDTGCTSICDNEGLREAFTRANSRANACASTYDSDNLKGVSSPDQTGGGGSGKTDGGGEGSSAR